MKFRHLYLFLFLIIWGMYAQAQYRLSGSVSDAAGKRLAYATISVDQARYGTLTDEAGTYEISLPAGTHEVYVSYLGHQAQQIQVQLNSDLQQDFVLTPETVVLEEVFIVSDGRDPAYAIIRKAIENKEKNSTPFPEYRYEAYTKTVMRFAEGFDMQELGNFPFAEKNDSGKVDLPPELQSDILYLSETLSEVSRKEPNKAKENIVYSRVSGASDQFTFLGNLFHAFTPYENRWVMEGVSDRGIVSPIANSAFSVYKFKLLGSVMDGGIKSYKIKVWPKQSQSPAYHGVIYIADSSYAVKELDLYVEKQQIQILDSVLVSMTYQPLEGRWVANQSRMGFVFTFGLLGVKIPFKGYSQSILSGYDLAPGFDKKSFNREIIAVSDSALAKPKIFWDSIRPLPLSKVEADDYQIKDSLEVIKNSPEYLDSLTREGWRMRPLDLLSGKEIRDYRRKFTFRIAPFGEYTGFNPIDGAYYGTGLSFEKDIKHKRSWEVGAGASYANGRESFIYKGFFTYNGKPKHQERLHFALGDESTQLSPFQQISPGLNGLYNIIYHENYLQLYRRRFARVEYGREILNGLVLTTGMRFERRTPLQINSNYSLFNKDAEYEPIIQINPHNALILSAKIRFQPFNQYISLPDEEVSLGSDFPVLELGYEQGIASGSELDADFAKLTFSMYKQYSLGLWGKSDWRIDAGRFLNRDNVFLPDLFYFHGNETVFSSSSLTQFQLLPYYALAQNRSFVAAHWEHDFAGFLTNGIPLLKKLKLHEFVGTHFLFGEDQVPYSEVHAGIGFRVGKFVPVRVAMVHQLPGNRVGEHRWGYRIGFFFR